MSNASDNNSTMLPLDEMLSVGDPGAPTPRVLRVIEGNHLRISRQLDAYYSRKKTWLNRLWPSKLDKILADGQLNLAKSERELNERVLQLAVAMKLDACRECADVWVKSMRVETRETFFAFVSERVLVLQETIERRRIEFSEHIARRYVTAEKYQNLPVLYAHYKNSIEDEIEAYIAWVDGLLNRFRAIVDERVSQYERPALPPS